MSEHYENTYDAIIIGAGIGGLVCGCYLAKAGLHDRAGDYFTSFKKRLYRQSQIDIW